MPYPLLSDADRICRLVARAEEHEQLASQIRRIIALLNEPDRTQNSSHPVTAKH